MNIDFNKTHERCRVLNLAQLGREVGISRAAVQMITKGTYKRMKSEKAQAVIGRLRDMGLLVEVPEADVSLERMAA